MARLRIAGVRVERQAGRVGVTVSLGHEGGVVTGQVDRPAGDAQTPSLAAEAALDALRQIAPPQTRWALDGTVTRAVAVGHAVIVEVILETEGGEEHLIGSALSTFGSLEDAAAQAVLDAVERRLGWYERT